MKQLLVYKKENNQKPFTDWFLSLDKALQDKVNYKLTQIQYENYSNCSVLKGTDGVKEARIHTASGLRIYFAEENQQIIILLAGGDKDTQKRDIQKATEYWEDYKQRR